MSKIVGVLNDVETGDSKDVIIELTLHEDGDLAILSEPDTNSNVIFIDLKILEREIADLKDAQTWDLANKKTEGANEDAD